MFELPAVGEVLVGRGEDAQLRLSDTGVSRRHALIQTGAGQATLVDQGSQNRTRVNGEVVVGARPLASGDVIAICDSKLVYHASGLAARSPTVLDLAAFRQRLLQELERSRRYHRPLTLVAAALGHADRPRIALALEQRLRIMDVAGWGGADQLLVLMPEVTAEEAFDAATQLLSSVQRVAPEARVGFASCPVDGTERATSRERARRPGSAVRRSRRCDRSRPRWGAEAWRSHGPRRGTSRARSAGLDRRDELDGNRTETWPMPPRPSGRTSRYSSISCGGAHRAGSAIYGANRSTR